MLLWTFLTCGKSCGGGVSHWWGKSIATTANRVFPPFRAAAPSFFGWKRDSKAARSSTVYIGFFLLWYWSTGPNLIIFSITQGRVVSTDFNWALILTFTLPFLAREESSSAVYCKYVSLDYWVGQKTKLLFLQYSFIGGNAGLLQA